MDDNPTLKPELLPTHSTQPSRPVVKRVESDETERPPSAQQRHEDASEVPSDPSSEDDPIDDDPAQKPSDFNWNDLHARYHAAINKCQGEENESMQEFQNLMTVLLRLSLL